MKTNEYLASEGKKDLSEQSEGLSDKPVDIQLDKHEGLPPISLHIVFGTHATAEDADRIAEPLKSADIYVPERSDWDPQLVYAMQDVAMGRKSPEEVFREQNIGVSGLMSGFIRRELEILYNSKKKIVIVDTPYDNELAGQISESFSSLSMELTHPASFGKKLATLREQSKKLVDRQNERENLMLVQLQNKVEDVVKKDSRLRSKDKINVLMFLGSYHTRFYREWKKAGQEATREFPSMPYKYSFNLETQRRLSMGKEVDYDLAARALLESEMLALIAPVLYELTSNYELISRFIRKIVALFSLEEIRGIFEDTSSLGFKIFDSLNKKGIRPPHSLHELQQFLEQKRSKLP